MNTVQKFILEVSKLFDFKNDETSSESEDIVNLAGIIMSRMYGKYEITVIKEIQTPSDLSFLDTIKIQARFNPNRNYKFFYFSLNSSSAKTFINFALSNRGSEELVEYIIETEKIKKIDL